ncbi:MAG: enoyl-CoA hydratase/isomerase family protein [Bacteroidia bacterium]|nr:enoyl-CoA hydratase/isomerase family protein [Bacteroidia bacterium]MCZ2247575.1 enoyl-CoA hydratase/isomerase family protein [Bacteroidia bacterium]
MSSTLEINHIESVLVIKLNRPDVLNSFNREMALALQKVLDNAENDKNIRAVLLTGNGKGFCAGQDLSEAINPDGPGIENIVLEHYNPIILKIRKLNKPIICAVNGVAAGAGANIALACDIVVAADNASFIQAFSKIGLIPDSGGTFFLPRLVGTQRALALMMLGDKISAKEAQQMGMIYQVGHADSLFEEALVVAKKLAAMPTKALAYTKQLLHLSATSTLEEQLKHEAEYQVKAASSYDYSEGVNAFLQKRPAVFKGE